MEFRTIESLCNWKNESIFSPGDVGPKGWATLTSALYLTGQLNQVRLNLKLHILVEAPWKNSRVHLA